MRLFDHAQHFSRRSRGADVALDTVLELTSEYPASRLWDENLDLHAARRLRLLVIHVTHATTRSPGLTALGDRQP